jgi:hypothetical protein
MIQFAAALALLLFALPARATVFDAADLLAPNAGAVSAMGEILLSDPTSEGVEMHGRYGLSEEWNVGAILGTGSKDKNFRFGGQGVFNLLPDWEGQLGLSFVGTALYLRRYDTGGLQVQVGPLLHKRITGWGGLPANLHFGLLWQLEARQDHLTSGTQLVVGSDFDVGSASRYYMSTELGVRLAKADSYVLLGFGMRLGDLAFTPRHERHEGLRSGEHRRSRARDTDYTDEDFQK